MSWRSRSAALKRSVIWTGSGLTPAVASIRLKDFAHLLRKALQLDTVADVEDRPQLDGRVVTEKADRGGLHVGDSNEVALERMAEGRRAQSRLAASSLLGTKPHVGGPALAVVPS